MIKHFSESFQIGSNQNNFDDEVHDEVTRLQINASSDNVSMTELHSEVH